jgi:predicted DNA-binding transcriptional regulator YafY
MTRAERLLQLMHLLRLYRVPVAGETLAAELGISLRTLYRDIATLQEQGAQIEGTPGRGYRLCPGFMLPPLMFTEEEIEALVLGTRWVASRTDPALSRAGRSALARIGAVLPADLREQLEGTTLFVPAGRPGAPADGTPTGPPLLPRLREAIRDELKIRIHYRNGAGHASERMIWPIALAFFDQVQVVSGWCELRQDFRNFRLDRISHLALTTEQYPRRRADLLPEWRAANGIPDRTLRPDPLH